MRNTGFVDTRHLSQCHIFDPGYAFFVFPSSGIIVASLQPFRPNPFPNFFFVSLEICCLDDIDPVQASWFPHGLKAYSRECLLKKKNHVRELVECDICREKSVVKM